MGYAASHILGLLAFLAIAVGIVFVCYRKMFDKGVALSREEADRARAWKSGATVAPLPPVVAPPASPAAVIIPPATKAP